MSRLEPHGATLELGHLSVGIEHGIGEEVRRRVFEDWGFGLTRADRSPKPALTTVRHAFSEVPFAPDLAWPRISVIVCSYNGARTIRDCLEALERLTYSDYEVIVVDDGSTDTTAAIARRFPETCAITSISRMSMSCLR